MKILIYNNANDFRFASLTKCLSTLGIEVGSVEGTATKQDIVNFNPTILIHNISSSIKEEKDKFAEIIINEETYKKIGPFTGYLKHYIQDNNAFKSDISYIGSPDDFGLEMYRYFNCEYDTKIFGNKPIPIMGYCGAVSQNDTFNIYKNSKVSIVPKNDLGFRVMDIIAAGGNPVKFEDSNQFHEDIKSSIGNKIKIDDKLRNKILKESTVFDKMSEILKNAGLSVLSRQLKNLKEKHIYE
jgi:hypothetical protein